MFKKKKLQLNASEVSETNLNAITDYTLLTPTVTKKELENFLCVAYKRRYYAVCVNPTNVKYSRYYIDNKLKSEIKIACVVGFPLGQNCIETKVLETKKAVQEGADEIDFVINLSFVKDGNFKALKDEVLRIVRASRGRIVKAIIETSALTKAEIIKVSQTMLKCRVDYIKTSTGYGEQGATVNAVEIIAETVKNKCGIKASGGIRTKAEAMNLVRMGANRIGTSSVL